MGFRSDGTCTKCGNETNQHDYVCDTCYRFDRIEEFRKQYPIARNIQAEDIEKFMALEDAQQSHIKSIHECLAQKKWAQVKILSQALMENEEKITRFKYRLETYKLELSYDEIKCIVEAMKGGQYSIATRDSIEAKIRKMVN